MVKNISELIREGFRFGGEPCRGGFVACCSWPLGSVAHWDGFGGSEEAPGGLLDASRAMTGGASAGWPRAWRLAGLRAGWWI